MKVERGHGQAAGQDEGILDTWDCDLDMGWMSCDFKGVDTGKNLSQKYPGA